LEKVRITGGEPLLRPGLADLVRRISSLGLEVALTTNGSLLRDQAENLREAGLSRVTVSLDALDSNIHSVMTDSAIPVEDVLDGIDAAREAGLSPVKVNCVVQRGVNESEVEKLITHFRGTGVVVRFIEYMDVGRTNGWQLGQIVPSEKILSHLKTIFDLVPLESENPSEVAVRWVHSDGSGEIGFISSVSEPFCENCSRIRLSADGLLVTCLFATGGHDIRALIQSESSENELNEAIAAIWQRRDDRYSENRSSETGSLPRIEMSYIGG
jgi:cyclic pyranopterin phosphate synthase